MDDARVAQAVRPVAERITTARELELVDVEVQPGTDGTIVRLYVDKEGGIGLDDLQAVSEEVAVVLDAEDPIDTAYTLEVSSPGLDRPLRTEDDFLRFAGRLARLESRDEIGGRRRWTGRIVGVEAGEVTLRLEREGGVLARVPLAKVQRGRLEVEFPPKHS